MCPLLGCSQHHRCFITVALLIILIFIIIYYCCIFMDNVCVSSSLSLLLLFQEKQFPAQGFFLLKRSFSLTLCLSGGSGPGFCLCKAPTDNFIVKVALWINWIELNCISRGAFGVNFINLLKWFEYFAHVNQFVCLFFFYLFFFTKTFSWSFFYFFVFSKFRIWFREKMSDEGANPRMQFFFSICGHRDSKCK